LDTFAYRQPTWAGSLRIFEVDYPATQNWKRERLSSAGIPVPTNLTFVPVDFERGSLREALASAGLDFTIPTFVSWLGVTQYLSKDAVDLTLKFVLSLSKASEIVFTFVLTSDELSAAEQFGVVLLSAINRVRGEPWLTRYSPHQLKDYLIAMSFSKVLLFSAEDANERYFRGRGDGMAASNVEQMIRAIV
jgi:methyltransferase (TIGR00027 family)